MKRARCESVKSRGMPSTRGSSERTRLTLAQGPSILMPAIARRNSSPRACASTRDRNVRFGSALETTTPARISRAVLEQDAAGPSLADVDAGDGRAGADLGSELAGRRGHRLRDGAHAADHVAVEALELVLAAREEMEQEADRRARRVRAAVLAVDVVREKERLDLLALVVAVEEVAEAPRQERDHAADLVPRDPAKAFADAEPLQDSGEPPGMHVRGRLQKEGLQIAGQSLELVVDPLERPSVLGPKGSRSPAIVRSRSDHQAATLPSRKGTSSAGSQGTMRRPWAASWRSRITSGRSMLAM